MRLLSPFAFAVLFLTAAPLHAQDFSDVTVVPSFPGSANGRYVGTISVTETAPRPPATAALPIPAPSQIMRSRATGRVQASIQSGKIRLLGTPGSNLLGYLDEPAYASISVDPVVGSPGGVFINFAAHARNGTGTIERIADRVRLRFELLASHVEFASGDQTVSVTRTVIIDLTRTGN
jgi:hypothetical protein